MKLRVWTSLVFFLSSYAPLAPIIIFKDYDLKTHTFRNPTAVVIVASIAVVAGALLFVAMGRIRHGVLVRVNAVSNKSGELVNYTIPYMISFFGFDLSDANAIFAFLFFLGLMYVLTVRTQNIFINPLLAVCGWALYEVTYGPAAAERQATFLSRTEFRIGDDVLIQRVARFFYVVTAINPED
jgi:hypothetical protein